MQIFLIGNFLHNRIRKHHSGIMQLPIEAILIPNSTFILIFSANQSYYIIQGLHDTYKPLNI
ncbi:unnamed protein product, partial [Arabidopsis halleri]